MLVHFHPFIDTYSHIHYILSYSCTLTHSLYTQIYAYLHIYAYLYMYAYLDLYAYIYTYMHIPSPICISLHIVVSQWVQCLAIISTLLPGMLALSLALGTLPPALVDS